MSYSALAGADLDEMDIYFKAIKVQRFNLQTSGLSTIFLPNLGPDDFFQAVTNELTEMGISF